MEHRISLAGKRCLITGATGGIGQALSQVFAEAGCQLLLTGRNQELLSTLQVRLQGQCPDRQITVFAADLQQRTAVQALIEKTVETYGALDILVNNAGVFPVKSLEESTLEDYERCLDINLRAPFALAQAFAPLMAKQGWGRIVNIGSSSAYAGFAKTSLYCASKHALLGLSRSLQAELKGRGVRSFFIAPGSVQTDMGRQVIGQDYDTFISPSEVAEYTAQLISYDGNMVSEEVRLNRMEIQ